MSRISTHALQKSGKRPKAPGQVVEHPRRQAPPVAASHSAFSAYRHRQMGRPNSNPSTYHYPFNLNGGASGPSPRDLLLQQAQRAPPITTGQVANSSTIRSSSVPYAGASRPPSQASNTQTNIQARAQLDASHSDTQYGREEHIILPHTDGMARPASRTKERYTADAAKDHQKFPGSPSAGFEQTRARTAPGDQPSKSRAPLPPASPAMMHSDSPIRFPSTSPAPNDTTSIHMKKHLLEAARVRADIQTDVKRLMDSYQKVMETLEGTLQTQDQLSGLPAHISGLRDALDEKVKQLRTEISSSSRNSISPCVAMRLGRALN